MSQEADVSEQDDRTDGSFGSFGKPERQAELCRWSLIELAEGRILKVRSCLSRFMQTGDRYDANKIKCETGLGFSRDESFKSVWSHFGSQQPQSGLIWTCKALLRLKGSDDFK
ncbi:hypothetical protein Q7P36_001637 [Cladosporium allicinum]